MPKGPKKLWNGSSGRGGGGEMVSGTFSRTTSARLAARCGVGSPRVSTPGSAHRNWWAAPPGPSVERIALAFFLASITLVVSCALYLYVVRYLGRGRAVTGFAGQNLESCRVFDGSWVPDDRYPPVQQLRVPVCRAGVQLPGKWEEGHRVPQVAVEATGLRLAAVQCPGRAGVAEREEGRVCGGFHEPDTVGVRS
jgi:hypothetical protein